MKYINLPPLKIKFVNNLSREELTKIADKMNEEENDPGSVMGLFVAHEQTIYIANDLDGDMLKYRVILHECSEALDNLCELNLENHTKVVALENGLLGFILNNKRLIQKMWQVYGIEKKSEKKTKKKKE